MDPLPPKSLHHVGGCRKIWPPQNAKRLHVGPAMLQESWAPLPMRFSCSRGRFWNSSVMRCEFVTEIRFFWGLRFSRGGGLSCEYKKGRRWNSYIVFWKEHLDEEQIWSVISLNFLNSMFMFSWQKSQNENILKHHPLKKWGVGRTTWQGETPTGPRVPEWLCSSQVLHHWILRVPKTTGV